MKIIINKIKEIHHFDGNKYIKLSHHCDENQIHQLDEDKIHQQAEYYPLDPNRIYYLDQNNTQPLNENEIHQLNEKIYEIKNSQFEKNMIQ